MDRAAAAAVLTDVNEKLKADNKDSISFYDVVDAYYGANPLAQPSYADAEAQLLALKRIAGYQVLYPEVLRAFEGDGEIEGMYWCERVRSAAALVRRPRPHAILRFLRPDDVWSIDYDLDWSAEDNDVVPHINTCASLVIRAGRLPKVEKTTAISLIYEAYSSALDALDKRREHRGSLTVAELKTLADQVGEAKQYYETSALAQANTLYFLGTLWGIALILVLYDAVSFLRPTDLLGPMTALVLSFGGGAAGALVSVMQRMGSKDGVVRNYQAPGATLRLFGMLRPWIGGFVGTAFHVLVVSGLVPLAVPKEATVVPYFFIGVAFLSGFSERWATDILAKPPAGISAPTSAEAEGGDGTSGEATKKG